MLETRVQFLGQEVPLEKGQATHSSGYSWASLVAQTGKNWPAMWETRVRSLGWEDPLEEGMAWQPSPVFLPGESPWTEEPGGLQPMGSQRVRHDRGTTHTCTSY